MNDQLIKQANDLREHFKSLGFQFSPTPAEGNLVEATIPSDRNRWVAIILQDPAEQMERLNACLWKNGEKVFTMPLNPAAPAKGTVDTLLQVIGFSVVNDADASNEEIEKAVQLVKQITPRGKHGFMGDKSTIAVLAEAILRLTDRIKKLEKGSS